MGDGKKFDSGKLMAGMMFNDFHRALTAVAEVATYGCIKYGSPSGWQSVENGKQRYCNAMVRHMLNENKSDCDEESGLMHAAHTAWNALAILELKLMENESIKKEVSCD